MIAVLVFVLYLPDERHRDDAQLQCEQFVF